MNPFTQGYIEALFAELNGRRIRATSDGLDPYAPSDLAPETLEAIRADCKRFLALYAIDRPSEWQEPRPGAAFWGARQASRGDYPAVGFPPLTVYLGDDGKVRLRAVTARAEAGNQPLPSP